MTEDRLRKNLPRTAPWTFSQRLENELSALGFYISAHPLDQYKHLIQRAGLATSATLENMADRKPVQIAVNAGSFSRRRTKTGKDMITINATDSFGNIDAVAFGDSAAQFAHILSTENVSIFVDSITPLNQWVAKIANKVTLDIWDGAVLPDVKKVLGALGRGRVRVQLNLHATDKVATLALPGGVELGDNTAADLIGLGVKVEIE